MTTALTTSDLRDMVGFVNSEAPDEATVEAAADSMRVLVIDDEKNIRTTLSLCLEDSGAEVIAVASAEAALDALDRSFFDIAFLDLRLGDSDGLELLPKMLALRPSLAVVIITAHAAFDSAVEAMRRGATDYIPKPFTPSQVRHIVRQLTERRTVVGKLDELASRVAAEIPDVELRTASPKMQTVLELLSRAAGSDAPMLLRGENGSGKGLLARVIHAKSRRATRPFAVVNCPTLSEDLLASELFGHSRGAFTGAVRDQAGRVESAEGGTLFLDEIGEISPGLQAKLLRFLQEKRYERVGENRTRSADVRIVAATNRDLEDDVRTGHFREDLLFRLNVIELRLPALRERSEDILPLARHFLDFFSRAASRTPARLTPEAEAALLAYPWPGNLRELRNTMERASILWPQALLGLEALPEAIAGCADGRPRLGGDFTLEAIEREHLLRVLDRTGSVEEAARTLGIDASTIWRKRRKLDG